MPAEVTDAGQGRLRVNYTAPRPGFYRLTISSVASTTTSARVPLGDSPYSLQVRESPLLTAAVDDNVENAPKMEDKVALWEQIAMVEFGAGSHSPRSVLEKPSPVRLCGSAFSAPRSLSP